MQVKVYKKKYDIENSAELEFDRMENILSIKYKKGVNTINNAEGISYDGIIVGGKLNLGEVVQISNTYYAIVDVTYGMSNLKQYFYKVYGG